MTATSSAYVKRRKQRLFKLGRLTITSTDQTDPIATLNAIPGGEQVVDIFRGAVTRLRQKNRVGVIETR